MLQQAMTGLKGQPTPGGAPFEPVHAYVINPKSITMGQLYGEFDLLTHEWTDGILPSLMRVGAIAEDNDKRWYVFDGPVDAVWIENMNTVLDDNKKLCLTSGEIIKMTPGMTMMFEVADLAVASPATVSRCGMVYLEPSVLGLPPFLNCWRNAVAQLAKPYTDQLEKLFEFYLLPAIAYLRDNLKEIVTSIDSALVFSFLNLMNVFLRPLANPDGKPPPADQFLALMPGLLAPWVIFATVWSVGATCDLESRYAFSNWIRDRMAAGKHEPQFPEEGIVYDYSLHDGGFTVPTDDGEPAPPQWIHWMTGVEDISITPTTKYSDIQVPTIDNVRSAELLGMLVTQEVPVACLGTTGTGKTMTIVSKLSRGLHKKFIYDAILFSARTNVNETQDLLDSKLDKRRKGIFGPPILKKQIFFIDDLNMPAPDAYGAQPPIELIRQWMDFRGWYDRKSIGDFRTIVDVNFVCAMAPAGGGRHAVTARLMRHFHYLAFTEMEQASKLKIFGTILKSWLDRTDELQNLVDQVVKSTLHVYNTILRDLLPTPTKTHYTFNLRDLSKVFQGILMANPETMVEARMFFRLWFHECCRVFQDRLINDEDRNWLDGLLRDILKTEFQVDSDETIGDKPIFFGDFMDPTSDARPYEEITDVEKMSKVLDNYLEDYNATTTKPVNLVLFLDAILHVCRISRVIRQPMGNALLLGMGGSGRQSLTRLAAHMAEYYCYQIELSKSYSMSDWRDDIKSFMMKAGVYRRQVVFLFSDTQIKSETFLEDLNNILNSGDVPNIYKTEELDKIYQSAKGLVSEMGLPITPSNMFAAYVKQVRSNLHTVITMSPIGDIFRARLRQFPALVNCCAIDWFSPWPESALRSVAKRYLGNIQGLENPKIQNGVIITCQFMHRSVAAASEQYLQELSRHNYVTPTSYLELLTTYRRLVGQKQGGNMEIIERLNAGMDKLHATEKEVAVLQKELKVMKPDLEQAQINAGKMLKVIEKDRAKAQETKEEVEKEEEEALKKANVTQDIAADAQRDLDEAMPALRAAEESLKALNKNDISEVRTMKKPPPGVHLVMETICIVKNVKPQKIPGTMPGQKILDYWEPGRNLLQNPDQFLTSLMEFDKESITEDMIVKLDPYVKNPNFDPKKIKKVSKACTSLCMWVHAMYKYYFINKAVAPKKAAYAEAKAALDETEKSLAEARERMRLIMENLKKLEDALKETEEKREKLQASMQLCLDRMDRATRLIEGLADEKTMWIESIANLKAARINIVGDILICSGAVAYLGPFIDSYRQNLLEKWRNVLKSEDVPFSPNCGPVAILGEAVQIRQWQLFGLPRDNFSVENAVMISNSSRWPLFIDPQGQANRWLKNMWKEEGISVAKPADKDLMRTLEAGVRFGKAVLIENVGTELDPALDSILLRQVFKQGGQNVIKIGDAVVPYGETFHLYITTKLPNPHYTPETAIKVLVINFTLVPSGLQDQLLATVVSQERADLEEARSAIIVSSAQMRQELQECEDHILERLSSSTGSPVDDIELIETLEASKSKSEEIKVKVAAAEETQKDIDATRTLYVPVATRGQILFFCVSDLRNIDPMYQYSLEWFMSIFIGSMVNTEKTDDIDKRIHNVNENLTFSLYSNVCRSLFARHKFQFAFLMCVRILMDEGYIDQTEWQFLLAGGSPLKELPNPAPQWLSQRPWQDILSLENLPNYKPFVKDFISNPGRYQRLSDSQTPHTERLPEPWDKKFTDFQFLLVLKCLRPDKVTNAMQIFISKHLGAKFIEPQTVDLQSMFDESSPTNPLVFVLSVGTDPAAEIYKFAEKKRFSKRMYSISLGQGQGPRAEAMLKSALETGFWVFFQNCHLSPSWMPTLEQLMENIPESTHKDFRVWLTSTPSPSFPVSILQNSSKVTVEPPRGLKANLLRAYTSQVTDFVNFLKSEDPKVPNFKLLLFSLCLFHGICLERRKFGALGFNIAYQFTDGDLRICISQLNMFLLEYDPIPYKVLLYTAGEINYGGRVTDDWDRRCIMNILQDYYRNEVLQENYDFFGNGIYHQIPTSSEIEDYLDYIRTLPLNDDPVLFGMHENADITYAQSETSTCLKTLLALQPRVVGGSAQNQDEVTANLARTILNEIPGAFDEKSIGEKYPVLYNESLNTVLVQEVMRFNRLLRIIHESLSDLLKAIKGLVVMSGEFEAMAASLFTNRVPTMWSARAYPSLKPLGPWVADLKARINFLNNWIDNGIPPVFWISGFYFPQAFLTGTMQNFARRNVVSIDAVDFGFKVLNDRPSRSPKSGCYIYGFFLEGCRWGYTEGRLVESRPKELYTDMPVIWLMPQANRIPPKKGVYVCPVYKTLTRAGTLSTTGHSTNFVTAIELPSKEPQKHWIQRGAALICALDF